MWQKLILLSLYILVLFFLSRLLEAAVWYHGDQLLFSHNVLDPFSLSVGKLRQLLDSRGVSYVNAIEKQDLTSLVVASGQVTQQELIEAENADRISSSPHQTVHFSCGSHFYEEVEDTKDSVWLVQVIADEKQEAILDANTWKQVVSKVGRFGVRTGIFKCSLDPKLCARKGWKSPLIVLALPKGPHIKEDVVMHSYFAPAKMQSVVQWLHQHLSSRVSKIANFDSLNSNWLNLERNSKDTPPLRVIFISNSSFPPPLFLSALAVKFNSRVQFGMIRIPKKASSILRMSLVGGDQLISKEGQINTTYLIATPEKVLIYGNKIGELYNFKAMELHLKTLQPEMNDIFLISLFLTNIMLGLELFLISGKLWRHFVRWLLESIKCNCILFLFWLVLLGAHKFQIVHSLTNFSLKFARLLGETRLATILRNDWLFIYSTPFLLSLTFIAFGLISLLIWKKMGYGNEQDIALFSDWWSLPLDSNIMNYFFRPMATLTRPLAPPDLDLEEGLEMFIERLAVPNLWLLPTKMDDYLKELPVWSYSAGLYETEDETLHYGMSSSEDETTAQRHLPSTDEINEVPPTTNHKWRSYFENFKHFLNLNWKKEKIVTSRSNGHKHHEHHQHSKIKNDIGSVATTSSKKDFFIPIPSNDKLRNFDQSPPGMHESYDCSICLENYHNGESLCGLPCGHNYHLNCIMLWLTRDNHCCPICRWPSFKPNSQTNQRHLHSQ